MTTHPTRFAGWVPFALIALVLIPAIAGSLRLVESAFVFRLALGAGPAACFAENVIRRSARGRVESS